MIGAKEKCVRTYLDRNSAPNNAYSKAVCCGEGGDYSGVPFQWEYHSLHTQEFDRVGFIRYGAPFRSTCLGCSCRVSWVGNPDTPLGSSNDHRRVHDIHRITPHRQLNRRYRVLRSQIPKLNKPRKQQRSTFNHPSISKLMKMPGVNVRSSP